MCRALGLRVHGLESGLVEIVVPFSGTGMAMGALKRDHNFDHLRHVEFRA